MASDSVTEQSIAEENTEQTTAVEQPSKDETTIDTKEDTKDEDDKKVGDDPKDEDDSKDKSKDDHSDREHNTYDDAEHKHRKSKKRNRSDYTSLRESNDESEIRKQVEFYFSDSNLPCDEYLLKLTGGYENKPVPLKTIHDFKRMRHFQPFTVVRAAVKASKFLHLDDKDQITRATPLDKKFTLDAKQNGTLLYNSNMARSIYAKGFGDEYSTMQIDIENYFKPYGPFNSVRMRRAHDGSFKGSVFVEFASEELAEQFLGLAEKPQWVKNTEGKETSEENDGGLLIKSKTDYVEGKKEDIRNGTVHPASPRRDSHNRDDRGSHRGSHRGRGRGRGGFKSHRGRRDRDDDGGDRRGGDFKNRESNGERRGGRRSHHRDDHKKRSRDDAEDVGEGADAKKQKASED